MLTTTHPGASPAGDITDLLTGIRLLDDALDALTQVRVELGRLIDETNWRADAVSAFRAALLQRRDEVHACCADLTAQRDSCLRGIA